MPHIHGTFFILAHIAVTLVLFSLLSQSASPGRSQENVSLGLQH